MGDVTLRRKGLMREVRLQRRYIAWTRAVAEDRLLVAVLLDVSQTLDSDRYPIVCRVLDRAAYWLSEGSR